MEKPSILELSPVVHLKHAGAAILVTDHLHRPVWGSRMLLESPFLKGIPYILHQPFRSVLRLLLPLIAEPARFEAQLNRLRSTRTPLQGWPFALREGSLFQLDFSPVWTSGHYQGSIWTFTRMSGTAPLPERPAEGTVRNTQGWPEKLVERVLDVRTPLSVISGMVHLMDETLLDEQQREYLKLLRHSTGILQALVTDMLNIAGSTGDEQPVHQREFDPAELIGSLLHTFRIKLGQRPIRISASMDARLQNILVGDDILLNQIMMSLLGNAERLTTEGEIVVTVSVEGAPGGKRWLRCRVSDTRPAGLGAEAPHQQPWYPAIARQLALHGGTINREDWQGYQVSYSFTLPFLDTGKKAAAANALAAKRQRRRQVSFAAAKVLVIEDNGMNLRYVISLLEKYKLDYQLATNGLDALYFLNSRQYDLILLDIKLTGGDSLELVSRIRGDERLPNVATPVIGTAAGTPEDTLAAARSAGITDILIKPYTPDQLLQILNKYLNEEETALIMEEVQPTNGFEFHRELDVKYLNTLYENNIAYAADLFEIFLRTIREEVKKLEVLVADSDWEQLRFSIHKLKPNFAMVGLTWTSNNMQVLENLLRGTQEYDAATIQTLFSSINADMQQYYPIVADEYERMKSYMESEQ